jgi:ribose transport system ATP-binding protein
VAIEVSSLSGGNQQKVAIAKLLATNPKVLLMDEPTRGVDVGAKSEIHHILRELANQGVGVIVISSELPEIIGLCDRALVIRDGRLAGELNSNEMTEEALLRLASGLCEQETA